MSLQIFLPDGVADFECMAISGSEMLESHQVRGSMTGGEHRLGSDVLVHKGCAVKEDHGTSKASSNDETMCQRCWRSSGEEVS